MKTIKSISERFAEAENLGRNIAQTIFNTQILPEGYVAVPAKDRRCYDLTIESKGHTVAIVEVKYRHCAHDKYEDAILTDTKYDDLLNKNLPAYYIAIYDDNKYFVWNLRKCKPTSNMMKCKDITILDDGDRRLKVVHHFRFEDAALKGDVL